MGLCLFLVVLGVSLMIYMPLKSYFGRVEVCHITDMERRCHYEYPNLEIRFGDERKIN